MCSPNSSKSRMMAWSLGRKHTVSIHTHGVHVCHTLTHFIFVSCPLTSPSRRITLLFMVIQSFIHLHFDGELTNPHLFFCVSNIHMSAVCVSFVVPTSQLTSANECEYLFYHFAMIILVRSFSAHHCVCVHRALCVCISVSIYYYIYVLIIRSTHLTAIATTTKKKHYDFCLSLNLDLQIYCN